MKYLNLSRSTRAVLFLLCLTSLSAANDPGDLDATFGKGGRIFRPATGEWWLMQSSAGATTFQFGQGTDRITPGDYTGDGKADCAVWRPSTGEWFVLRSEDSSYFSFPFGTTGDLPAPGDYGGDGKFDAVVFRPSSGIWFVQQSTNGLEVFQWGLNGDRPVSGSFVR